ncbi:MAG TPA: glutamine synthetase family protein [Ilumatobacteraceae bacterium]|nr:glutamine synthetase family protein [Ilumatobacteraceae bacterium]
MGNRRVRVMWSDLNGLSHGRYVPRERLHGHGHHAVTTLTMGINRDIIPVEGYGPDVGFADLATVPLPESVRPGWEVDTDVAIADLEYNDAPLALCPRGALKRSVEAWRALGYDPQLGFEMEFYVMQPDPDAPGGFGPLNMPSHRVYGVGLGGDNTGLMFELYDAAEACELDLEGMLGEFHPGQMELNMRYGPALDAADRAFICKEMTREIAARNGYWITYMGRPMAHLVGSGLHINVSFTPVHGGPNCFDDPQAQFGLSTLARQSLGGLIAHHEGIAALSAPLVNSYKRLIPGIIAGYWANWGLDNRISTYRVPGERGAATRIENRMPCGSANPYLAAAAMLNAALLGVVDGRDCGEPQVGDADSEPNTDRHTPHDLGEALDALAADTVLTEAMGPELVKAFLTLRRDELAKWQDADGTWDVEQISAWELEQYLPFF